MTKGQWSLGRRSSQADREYGCVVREGEDGYGGVKVLGSDGAGFSY